jgi:hypothetical protein
MKYLTITTMLRGLFVSAMLVMQAVPAWAIDGFAVEVGQDRKTDMARIAAQWQWSKRWLQGQAWHVGGYWDLSVAQWERDQATPGDRKQVTEIGLTPVFRLQGNDLRGLYLEGGIGAHLLSATQLGDKRFSTAFQFGEHLGFGYRFGVRGAMDVSYRYQHLSNADIKKPNDGINAHQLRLLYWFQ